VRAPAALAALIVVVAAAPAQAATISVNDTAAGEGAELGFVISLDAPAETAVQVAYATAKGTAGAADFEPATGRVDIPAGATSVPVPVSTKSDRLIEPSETLTLDLSEPSGATIADAQGVGTIDNVPVKGKCKNELTGTKKRDTLTGTELGDLIVGLAENDTITGLGGDDCLDGKGGRDTLVGGPGADELSGGGDGDTLDGGPGDDKINAGSGAKNKVLAGEGNDNVATQNGKKDTVDCGPGSKDKVRADRGDSVKNCEVRIARK
jgi:Ca2+-binding RTX toxin-like protein